MSRDFSETRCYWSLTEIANENDIFECRFRRRVFGLKWLEGDSSDDVLEPNKIMLPFWLVSHLHRRNLIELFVPLQYSKNMQSILGIQPTSVSLSKLAS